MRHRKPNYKLKEIRHRQGMNQKDMANMLGIGISTYNRKENGISDFTESEIAQICNILDVIATDIFFT